MLSEEYRELSLLLEKVDEEVCDRLCILNCPFCCENFGGEKCALEVVQHFVKKKLCKIADGQGYCCPLRKQEEIK